jgi:uncharacterized protein YjbI with pentapeptide repeats
MSKTEVLDIEHQLNNHDLWLQGDKKGVKAKFDGDNLVRCKTLFKNKNLNGASFKGCRLWESDFEMSALKDTDFSHTSLNSATLKDTQLNNALFDNYYLYCTDFRDADLTGASFQGACLTGANFEGAILEGADLNLASFKMPNSAAIRGNGKEIKTMRCDTVYIAYTDKILAFDHYQLTLNKWFLMDDEAFREHTNQRYLDWWKEWKPQLIQLRVFG